MNYLSQIKSLDSYRGEIFRLYIVLNKTARELIEILKQKHSLDVSPKVLKTKLNQWGYTKNIKRCDALQVLREKARLQSAGIDRDYTITLRQRPVDLKKVERYRQRAGLRYIPRPPLVESTHSTALEVAYLTPPPTPPSLPNDLKIPTKLLYDIDNHIKRSFETGLWTFQGNDLIIKSSPSQHREHKILHHFLADFAIGCHAADASNYALAGTHWRRAFLAIESLVQAQYHDILPNLVQKINDLNRQGHMRLAALLKQHISQCGGGGGSREHTPCSPLTSSRTSIFAGLGKLDMRLMGEAEERIMRVFTRLFELYLGGLCYNSFVVLMDEARRRLLQCPRVTFDCLPNLAHLDMIFGPTERRALDVVSLRVEVLSHRGRYAEMEVEAVELVRRAEMIYNDLWQRFYNLTRAWYFLGCAQYFLRKRNEAIWSLSNALSSDDELLRVDEFHIFNTERMVMVKYLEHLRSVDWDTEQEVEHEGLSHPVGSLMFFRCCKEPMRPNTRGKE